MIECSTLIKKHTNTKKGRAVACASIQGERSAQPSLPFAATPRPRATNPAAKSAAHNAPMPAQFIKAEANLLRFPVFALQTKGLRTVDGIECVGKRTENGATHEFLFRVTRNTNSLYPGPLSRKAHFAILSLLSERGLPLKNPVQFTWRDLARRMGVSYSGANTISKLKHAIESTHGIVITTEYALKSGADRSTLPRRKRGYHLYDEYVFVNESMPDGSVADRNYLWLSDWYVANLNAMYSAPLDYGLWQQLNDRSPIASRMYEFLLFNCCGGFQTFTINYPKLAQFLPVKVERYASDAHKQLDQPLAILKEHEVIDAVEWGISKTGGFQLKLSPGRLLQQPKAIATAGASDFDAIEDVTVREIRNRRSPPWMIVAAFHKAWSGANDYQPTQKELAAARELLKELGRNRLERVLPKVVLAMRRDFPKAKTFGATRQFFREVASRESRRERALKRDEDKRHQEKREAEKREEDNARLEKLRPLWNALPFCDQQRIRSSVLASQPALLANHPTLVERLCLREFAQRRSQPT